MNKQSAIALVLFFFMYSSKLAAQNFDINLLKPINKNETTFKNKYLELNASSVTALSVGLPAGIAIAGFIQHDKKLQRDALYMGGSFILSSVITQATKRIVNRQRPFEKYSFIIQRDDESGGLSFPSGHTSAAFCTATSIALRYRKWYYVAPAYVFATSVGWARMYQGVHYPSDVLAGAVVGAGSAWLGWKLQKMMYRKLKPVTTINARW
ncbi:phosphatase PAP2 family protein [Ferruginibacter sp. SUN106]|uniref:phosphatase PAP2 family protein n=1 Tax=Ferruginibacter sp. SUN106 TaxID=2978348 RepID=UPI003D35CCCB